MPSKIVGSLFLVGGLWLAGCSGSPAPKAPTQTTVTISTNAVMFAAISEGATSDSQQIVVTNSGTVALNFSSVQIAGANTADFNTTNGCTGPVAASAFCTITVAFAPKHSGQLSEAITLTDNSASSPQVVNVSGTANPIVMSITPTLGAITTAQSLQFQASGDPSGFTWSVVGAPFAGAPSTVASPGTVDTNGNYTPPAGGASFYATVTAASKTDSTKTASATINVVAPGVFTNTNNVQVAQYAVTPPSPATVSVEFGPDTSYGLNTWTQPTPAGGGAVSLYVAGMRIATPYHMRGLIQFLDGTSITDADFTFTTGTPPVNLTPLISVTTTAETTPQPGLELLDAVTVLGGTGRVAQAAVVDLAGNVLWAYGPALPGAAGPNPVKLLPNGHFLISFSGQPDGSNSLMQEVDLGGNVIWQLTAAQLNTALANATCAECNVTVIGMHHDFQALPNGHVIVLASTTTTLSDGTTPTGDVIIDLGDMENVGGNNPNHTPQPVWAWNEFNHLDTNRRPYSYPDWTHTNAILYSKDDGNLIISIRHQNWLVKIDYNNGTGAGDVLWKLGAVLPTDTGADVANFTLLNADGSPDTNGFDWFFAQHGPSFTTTNTTGQFGLTLFDNGDDRAVVQVAGGTCGGIVACYSTVPVFTIDETAMTATLHSNAQNPDYTFFGGNAEQLANGHIEFDECTIPGVEDLAAVYEVTPGSTPQTVWVMRVTGQDMYRAMRIPSLYPGVQW